MEPNCYDVVIVGGGPAGLTAGLYASRSNLKVLVLEKGLPGGMMNETFEIENYPGFTEPITGMELSQRMSEQAKKFGAEIKTAAVKSIRKQDECEFLVETDSETYDAKSVIVCTGVERRKLDVPGHEKYYGRGISYCATCDGPLYRGKDVVVVGGGDSAVEEAIFLTRFADGVHIIHRRDRFRADPGLAARALGNEKIKVHWDSVVTEIKGSEVVESVHLKNIRSDEATELKAEGCFIFVGFTAKTDFLQVPVTLNRLGFVRTKKSMETKTRGLFVCGDIRANLFKQIAVAVGEGATAARGAEKYLEEFHAGSKYGEFEAEK
ncbi:MAG: thioredoxin-disulfide reductase [Planctomycetota bacterium]|jgi:thioredoxin reductase (NADPH)